MTRKNKDGETLYPVCDWEENQYKLYSEYDRIMVHIYDTADAGKDADALYASLHELEEVITLFNNGVADDGIVYATWKDGQRIKNYIWMHNARRFY